MLERRTVSQERRDGQKAIEPATCLVDTFTDEIGRKLVLEQFSVLERVMPLGERHRPGVEPDVDDPGRAPHGARTARCTVPGEAVHKRLVRIDLLPYFLVGSLPQFGDRTDALHVRTFLVIALPDRKGRTPVPVPREGPVLVVLEPFTHPTRSDLGRDPIDLTVRG